jgi:uncharacterized membrane protein YgcG
MKPNLFSAVLVSVAVALPGSLAQAQSIPQQNPYEAQQAPYNAQPYGAQPQQQQPAQVMSQDQLQNLVAPIALYPDALLSEILVAATYPLEVVEAGQWLQLNRNLKGQDLVTAAGRQDWDGSVQALVAFPDVVNRLNSDIRWTTDLGNAFLAQQGDVMNAVQTLRAQAQSNGRLQSNQQQTVTTEAQGPQSAIEIQPADPEVVYVPQYDPNYVWGPPAYGYYPPLYYPEFGFNFGYGIPIGGYFGGLGWNSWGWGPNWFGGGIFVNNYFFTRYGFHGFGGGARFGNGNLWAHNPEHRMGVPYSNSRVANNFRGSTAGNRSFANTRAGSSFRGTNQFNASRPQNIQGQRPSQGQQQQSFRAPQQQQQQSFRAPQRQQQQSFRAPQQQQQQSFRAPQQQQSFRAPQQQQSFRAPQQQQSRPQASGGGAFRGGGGGGNRGGGGGGGRSHR